MIKFDLSDFRNFKNEIDIYVKSLEKGIKDFFERYEVWISYPIIKYIKRNVYESFEPNWYKRTGNLLKAVRVNKENDKIFVYIDGDWLSQQPNAQSDRSIEFGTDPGSSGDYSINVEEGYTYHNTIFNSSSNKYVKMDGRHFVGDAFKELNEMIDSGKIDIDFILEHLIWEWNRRGK